MKLTLLGLLLCLVAALSAEDIPSLNARAEQGDVGAMIELAKAYEAGRETPVNDSKAVEWYQKAADHGNAEAQNTIGVKYRMGEGVPKDPATAAQWYEKSARNGYPDAMFNLGAAYYNGDGVAIDDARSLAWFLIAAEFGSPRAPEAVQRGMEAPKLKVVQGLQLAADMFVTGKEVPARPQAAIKVLDQAVAMGSNEATIALANLYLGGRGVEHNRATAIKYCQLAADNHYPPAMTRLGQLYQTGLPPDLSSAFGWYQKGAGCGEVHSMMQLAKMYQDGSAGRIDKIQAYAYFFFAGRVLPEARDPEALLWAGFSKKEQSLANKKTKEIHDKASVGQCNWGDVLSHRPLALSANEAR